MFERHLPSRTVPDSSPGVSHHPPWIMEIKKIKRREVAHAMGEVANADMCRRNVLAEVAHVCERCRSSVNFLKPY